MFDGTMEVIRREWPDQEDVVLPFVSVAWQDALQS